MTLRDTVSKWHAAMCLLEENMFTEATQKLLEIQKPSARILSNLGCICMLQQRYEDAIQYFNASIEQDQYLAVALYQRGICYHKLQRYDKAINDFRNARSMLRSEGIDYKQLGAEILLTPQLLDQCITIIEDNLNKRDLDKLQTYSVLDCIFRPPITVVDNLVKHNFLGNATVISSTEEKYIVAAPERRQLPQSKMRFPNQTSLSVPSSPASSRIHQTTSNSGRTYISPPKRPPPRLLPDGSKMHQKSRSLEDVSSYAIVSEIIDESTSSVSRTAQTKPKPIYDKISSPTTFKPKLGLSPAITLNQSYINESDSKISLACHTKNLAIIIQPASHASVGELSTNLDKQMSRLENNPGKQIPLRSPIVELGQGSYVGQEENVDSNPGYLLGHAARMRSVFESNQECVSKTNKPEIALRNKSELVKQDKYNIAQMNGSLDIAQSGRLNIVHHSRPEIAKNTPDIAQINRPDISHRSKPNISQRNMSNIAQTNRQDIVHIGKPDNETDVTICSLRFEQGHHSVDKKQQKPARPPPPKLSK